MIQMNNYNKLKGNLHIAARKGYLFKRCFKVQGEIAVYFYIIEYFITDPNT